jgi:hypothetical protein
MLAAICIFTIVAIAMFLSFFVTMLVREVVDPYRDKGTILFWGVLTAIALVALVYATHMEIDTIHIMQDTINIYSTPTPSP